jgi:hypothetical protein
MFWASVTVGSPKASNVTIPKVAAVAEILGCPNASRDEIPAHAIESEIIPEPNASEEGIAEGMTVKEVIGAPSDSALATPKHKTSSVDEAGSGNIPW